MSPKPLLLGFSLPWATHYYKDITPPGLINQFFSQQVCLPGQIDFSDHEVQVLVKAHRYPEIYQTRLEFVYPLHYRTH